jgi:hypothetical protein
MLNVIILNVVMPSVLAPPKQQFLTFVSRFSPRSLKKKYFQDGDDDKSVNRPTTPTSLI